jgi:hypothetical protein
MSERDTHFRGFAHLLMQEIDEQIGAVTEWGIEHEIDSQEKIGLELYSRWRTVIARRAYDLVFHTIMNIDPYHLDALSTEEIPARIPDMTEWPVEPTEGNTA